MSDYVGYWPAQNAVVVAHEGTDPTQLYVSSLVTSSLYPPTLTDDGTACLT
jgi:hypothetical protein